LSVPSRHHYDRPQLKINEGGEQCFAPGSAWFKLKHSDVTKVKDALSLGGTDPKFVLTNSYSPDFREFDEFRSMWKPQLPVGNHHFALAQNEVIVFHLDCLLHLTRTPAATVFPILLEDLEHAMSDKSFDVLQERRADWKYWKESGTVHGAAQVFWPHVSHVNVFGEGVLILVNKLIKARWISEETFVRFVGGTSASVRELATRDMLDFISGNWDRSHNQFHIYDKERRTTELIYLDHNHLKTSEGRTFRLRYCRFWREHIRRLRAMMAKGGLTALIRRSIRKYEEDFTFPYKQDEPLRNLDVRAAMFLVHVDRCVQDHGEAYVFDL